MPAISFAGPPPGFYMQPIVYDKESDSIDKETMGFYQPPVLINKPPMAFAKPPALIDKAPMDLNKLLVLFSKFTMTFDVLPALINMVPM